MSLSLTIAHRFADFALDVAVEAPPGVTALFGRSGSGKTTVVNAVAGLLRPDRGRIVVDGTTLCDTDTRLWLPPHKRRLGYVFQEGRLFPHLNVRQNLCYGRRFARATGKAPQAEFDRIVTMLGIGDLLTRRPGALSGGEKQRVAIGRALLSAPRMLLMDEPLAALDDARKAEILPYLERLRDETEIPILYVSHALAEVARLATTVVVLQGGKAVRTGPAQEVLADPDTTPLFGVREAGAMLRGTVAAHHSDGLSEVETSAGRLFLPQITAAPGSHLRVRIEAQDVLLSLTRPEGVSALNILPVTVTALRRGEGPGVMVQLRAGQDMLLARITQRSADALQIAPGLDCYAVMKSVAVAGADIGAAV